MKKKKSKPKNKAPSTEAIPFPETSLGSFPSPWGALHTRRITGKLGEKIPLAFSLSIPSLPQKETAEFLEKLRLHYYRFLKKESKKEADFVRFAALDWHLEENVLSLFATLGPFDKREKNLVAILTLNDTGSITKIQAKKKMKGP